MAAVDPNAPLYKVVGVTDSQLMENGVYTPSRRIQIQLPNRDYAYVEIPASDFSAERAAMEIQQIAADIVEVLNMESAIKAKEAPRVIVDMEGNVTRMLAEGDSDGYTEQE